jgi:hypothetical protein
MRRAETAHAAYGGEKEERHGMERERIEVPVRLVQDETDALATVLRDYYGKLRGIGLPKDLSDRLLVDFQNWVLSHYRLTTERE